VKWRPAGSTPDYPRVHEHELSEYHGEWRIPQIEEPMFGPKNSEMDEWSGASADFPSFIRQVTKQVLPLSPQRLSFFELEITIAASFTPFLEDHSLSDDRFGRSRFRISWWIAAKESVIVRR
jgi:hypothetical protein